MKIDQAKKFKWSCLLNRKQVLLFHSLADVSDHKYFEKLTRIPFDVERVLRDSGGDIYFPSEMFSDFTSALDVRNIGGLREFEKKAIRYVGELDRFTDSIKKNNLSKTSNIESVKMLEKYRLIFGHAAAFLTPLPLADKMISARILELLPEASDELKQKWLSVLTFPMRENEHTKEEHSLYQLAMAREKNGKNMEKKIKLHLGKFSWIGGRTNKEYAWTEKDMLDRIEGLLKKKKDLRAESENLKKIRLGMKDEAKKIIERLRVEKNGELFKLLAVARRLAYLRTWRSDVIYRSFFVMGEVFYGIARRFDIDEKSIYYFTYEELLQTARTGKLAISRKEIEKRKEYYIKIVERDKNYVYSGGRFRGKLDFLKQGKEDGAVRGKTGYPGKARGKAVVVKKDSDIRRVGVGDVLVAVMTFPNYVPAMEKAAAFVTDEGGILCHAAIISREMKKPCIIATKNATKVLNDGDLVEVDAEKGVVRILKK